MVCHRLCPQALAEALKVNQTVTNIDLRENYIGNEEAKAWCLARGLRLQASKRWNKMESSGVPVVFETCETLVLLDRCRACASFQESHWNGMETRWKWDGGGCSDTCKAREKIQYTYQAISGFCGNSPWLWLVILASIFSWVDVALF